MLIRGKKYILTSYSHTSFAEKPGIVEYVRPYEYLNDRVIVKNSEGTEIAVARKDITFIKE